MSRPDIRAGLDRFVLMRRLTGEPATLAVAAREYLAGVEESEASGLKLVTFEKAAIRPPGAVVIS